MADDFRPNRCQAGTKIGQCNRDALPGSHFCYRHDHRAEDNERKMYQLTIARDRQTFDRMANSEELLSLRNEIALQRMLIEERVNESGQSAIERLSAFNSITAATAALEKLIKTAHAMEQKLGNTISKSTLIQLAADMMKIVTDELQGIEGYEEIVDSISQRLIDMVQSAKDEDAD